MLFNESRHTSINEIERFIPISKNTDFKTISPHIEHAEQIYLIPVIGKAMYDELDEFYADVDIDSPKLTEIQQTTLDLLKTCQDAVIHLAFYLGFDMLNTYISDSGFRRTESETVKPLFKYQETNLRNSLRTTGFNQIDAALLFLDENIDSFGEFKSAKNYAEIKQLIIPNTNTFNKIVFIANSRLTFMRLVPHMQTIELTEIAPLLGAEAYSYIKTEMAKPTPAEKVLALLPYLQRPIAFFASALLMDETGAQLTDNGLYFSQIVATSDNITEHRPATDSRIALLAARARDFGRVYIQQLSEYLLLNAAEWPTISLSDSRVIRRDNTNKRTFWA